MKWMRRLLLIWAACGAMSAWGWGDEGHETIGAMADQLLAGKPAADRVHALIGNETLASASLWADQIKYRTNQWPEAVRFREANPNHAAMHYTDIPFEETKYRDDSVGARPDDIAHAMEACILILQGKAEAQNVFHEVDQKIALRLLAHYVGDIHQPLHVGSGYLDGIRFIDPNGYGKTYGMDAGGNSLFWGTNKLHFYWDVTVVTEAMRGAGATSPQQWATKLLAQPQWTEKETGNALEWPRKWANESLALSAEAHAVTVLDEEEVFDRFTGKSRPRWRIAELSPGYETRSIAITESQIRKAGHRLAQILETIWP